MMDITLANLRDSRIIDLLSTHMITARASGLSRLSLETGSWTYFDPARRFYASHGFVECPPFADDIADPNSVFLSLDLRPA